MLVGLALVVVVLGVGHFCPLWWVEVVPAVVGRFHFQNPGDVH